MSPLLDLAGAKAQLNMTTGDHDAELEVYVQAAVDLVQGVVGPVDPTPLVQLLDGPGPWILDVVPVLRVDQVELAGQAQPTTAVVVDAGVVRRTQPGRFPLVLRYTAGRDPVPGALQLAARIVLEHLWKTQRGSAGGRGRGAEDAGPVAGMGFAVPYRAADLMRAYELPPAVA